MSFLDDIKRIIEQEAYRFYEQHTETALIRDSNGNIASQGHNDALDAFRHAYTSGRVTQIAADNQWVAEYFGNKNEIGDDHPNDPYEHRMDLWNNEVGRRIGDDVFTKEELAERLAQELNNGNLITNLNDQRLKDLYPDDPRLKLPLDDHNRKILTKDDTDKINDDIRKYLNNNLSDSGKFINDLFDTLKQSIIDLNPEIFDLFNDARITASPLVFDLDGDGIEISQLGKYSPILFDHDANGVKTGTAWLKSDDALLVLDRNGNGTIDSGQELFGNNTLLSNGTKAADGYAALSDLDSNGDGMIDAQDAQFDELRLWRDLNQDGISDTGELFRLDELGITQINLDKTAGSQTLSDGTRLDGSASFLMNGETRSYTDAWFAENRFYRTFNDSVPLTAEAALLPEMKGAGAVRDLREAASLDTGLATLVTDMQSDNWVSREQMMAQLDVLVHQWARTAGFQTSRETALAMGAHLLFRPQDVTDAEMAVVKAVETAGMDKAQALAQAGISQEGYDLIWSKVQRLGDMLDALEAFNGRTLYTFSSNSMTSGNGTIRLSATANGAPAGLVVSMGPNQTSFLLQSYDALRQSVYDGLSLQTRLNYMNAIGLTIDATGIRLDFSEVDRLLDARHEANAVDGLVDLLDLMRSFGDGVLSGWSIEQRLSTWIAEAESQGNWDEIRKAFTGYSGMRLSAGNDFYLASTTDRSLNAGAGDDFLVGNSAANTLDGGDGNDRLFGGAGDDLLYGANGNDIHDGGAGNDIHYESLGDDVYLFGRGDGQDVIMYKYSSGGTDVIRLKDGVKPEDVLLYRSTSSRDLILAIKDTGDSIRVQDWATNASVRIERIEFTDGTVWDTDVLWAAPVLGSEGDDTINAVNPAGDTLRGLGGNDRLNGGSGDDVLEGGDGDDILYGGAGNDVHDGGAGNDTHHESLGDDVYLFGRGDGQDVIMYKYSSGGTDVIRLKDGVKPEDVLLYRSTSSSDLILAIKDTGDSIRVESWATNPGIRIERVEFADGTAWDTDVLWAAPVLGSEGDDTITAISTTGDTLRGLGGNDRLNGSSGNDVLRGGAGNDYLSGDTGSDTYLFGPGDGADTIYNYDTNAASIDIARFEDVSFEDLWFNRSGNNLQISIAGTDDRVTINHWYSSVNYQLDRIEAGSSILLNTQVEQLVSAMASYAVPSGVGNLIPPEVKDELQPVLAHSWHSS
jgi:Ca2+-binding RTX toxin-like protein